MQVSGKNMEGSGKNKKDKNGISLVDLGYRRAKAAKAVKKALDAGKIVRKASKKPKQASQRTQSRTEEMRELFQSDMSERKQRRSSGTGNRKSKNSFKSKSRYESAYVSPPFSSNLKFQGILCAVCMNYVFA